MWRHKESSTGFVKCVIFFAKLTDMHEDIVARKYYWDLMLKGHQNWINRLVTSAMSQNVAIDVGRKSQVCPLTG
jgi:hypothetical protein